MTRRSAVAGAWFALTVALAVAWWSGASLCPVAMLIGIPCPGCGLGRATLALVAGHPIAALHLHPLVFVALPALAFFSFRHSRRMFAPGLSTTLSAAVLLAAFVGVWAARFDGAFGGPVPVRSIFSLTSSK